MKFTSTIIALAAFFSVVAADTQPVRYNTFYDNPSTSMNNVACSNGQNGLVTKGFPTFGSLPDFPNVGGAYAIGAWNSPECGSCWQLTYPGTGNSIWVTAIDTVYSGFDISLAAMNSLTNGQAQQFSYIDVESTQVDESYCGV
jgi:hypothetical protein